MLKLPTPILLGVPFSTNGDGIRRIASSLSATYHIFSFLKFIRKFPRYFSFQNWLSLGDTTTVLSLLNPFLEFVMNEQGLKPRSHLFQVRQPNLCVCVRVCWISTRNVRKRRVKFTLRFREHSKPAEEHSNIAYFPSSNLQIAVNNCKQLQTIANSCT